MKTGIKALADSRSDVFHVRLDAVQVEEGFNPRVDMGNLDELAQMIASEGQKVPGEVRLSEDGKSVILNDGHRRFAAIKLANQAYGAKIETFKCVKEARGTNAETRLLSTLVSNSGKPLTILEMAVAYKRLLDYGMTPKELSRRTGKSVTSINRMLDLLAATPELRQAVKDNRISVSAAYELAKEPEATQRRKVAEPKPRIRVSDVTRKVYSLPAKRVRDSLNKINGSAITGDEKTQGIALGLRIALGELTLAEAMG